MFQNLHNLINHVNEDQKHFLFHATSENHFLHKIKADENLIKLSNIQFVKYFTNFEKLSFFDKLDFTQTFHEKLE